MTGPLMVRHSERPGGAGCTEAGGGKGWGEGDSSGVVGAGRAVHGLPRKSTIAQSSLTELRVCRRFRPPCCQRKSRAAATWRRRSFVVESSSVLSSSDKTVS